MPAWSTRQDNSTSPQIGTAAPAAAASTGASGRNPGLVTTRANSPMLARSASNASMSTVAAPSGAHSASASRLPSVTVTAAPRSVRGTTVARPEMPAPATRTLLPRSHSSSCVTASASDRGEILAVEQCQANRGGDGPEQPEPDDDGGFRPSRELEVVVEGRHAEHPPTARAEHRDLDDHRGGLRDEQGTDDDHQQLGAGGDRQTRQHAAQGQRPGVAHEDLGRRGVPPQEADARRGPGRADQGQIQRVPHVVAALTGAGLAGVAVLPE